MMEQPTKIIVKILKQVQPLQTSWFSYSRLKSQTQNIVLPKPSVGSASAFQLNLSRYSSAFSIISWLEKCL